MYFVGIAIVFFYLQGNSNQLNFKWPASHLQLTPCHSTYTLTLGSYMLDYDSKITGNYHSK